VAVANILFNVNSDDNENSLFFFTLSCDYLSWRYNAIGRGTL